ncbi:MAG: hypothetical protein HC799_17710 [Limnothrix sp. RL_2_0]|nr:hypothetical protein [Limnothrix sp. RL_2_0]
MQPEVTVFTRETEQEMKAWRQRRQQLIEMMSAEKIVIIKPVVAQKMPLKNILEFLQKPLD